MLHPNVIKYLIVSAVALAGCKKNVATPPRNCNQVIAELKENKNFRYEYSANGKMQSVMMDNLPGKTILVYDTAGRLINSGTNIYRYENNGKKIIDSHSNIYLLNYNGQVIYWESPPENNQLTKGTFEYDNNGFMTKSKNYTYNAADLSNYIVFLDITYTNTVVNGNLTQVNVWRKYNRAGAPASLTTSSFKYTYDAARPNIPDTDYRPYKYAKRSAGLLLSETDGTTTNNYTYKFDAKGRVTQVDKITGGTIETIRTFKYKCD